MASFFVCVAAVVVLDEYIRREGAGKQWLWKTRPNDMPLSVMERKNIYVSWNSIEFVFFDRYVKFCGVGMKSFFFAALSDCGLMNELD